MAKYRKRTPKRYVRKNRRTFKKRARKSAKIFDQMNRVLDYVGPLVAETENLSTYVVNWCNNYVDPNGNAGIYISPSDSTEFNDTLARFKEYKITYCKIKYMMSSIFKADNAGINDTIVFSQPDETNLIGISQTEILKSKDYKVYQLTNQGGKNVITKGVNVQKYLKKRNPTATGWLYNNELPLKGYRTAFNTNLSNFSVGDRVGSIHVKWYVSFRQPL